MITTKTFRVPIYGFLIKIHICDNILEGCQLYNEYDISGSSAFTIDWGNNKCTVAITPNNINSMIHELEHVKNIIWKAKGYTPQVDNDEPDAYLIGYLAEQTQKIINKHLASKD